MIDDAKLASEQSIHRRDLPGFSGGLGEQAGFWMALSETPGIGVSIVDLKGSLIFVNKTSLEIFSGRTDIDYHGKTIGDFHSPEFTGERLALLAKVVETGKPHVIRHVYLGRKVVSTLWPIRDKKPPFNRIIVVTKYGSDADATMPNDYETVDSDYIELGELNVLTKRELEVFVMFGHGLNIPAVSKILYRSPKTLERHKTAIAKKLGLKSQTEIVRLVSLLGLTFDDAKRTRLTNEPIEKVSTKLNEILDTRRESSE